MNPTFAQARKAVTDLLGVPTEPHGFEGPDRFIVIPVWEPSEAVYNDTVVTVHKRNGDVVTEPYVAEVMDAWPEVR